MSDSNYWIWCYAPSSEEDMYIEGTPSMIEENNLEFDNGVFLPEDVPEIILQLNSESEGAMTDHIVAPGVKGLLMRNQLLSLLKNSGVDNLQDFSTKILAVGGGLISDEYRIVNIIGLIEAIDISKSDIEMVPSSEGEIEFINSLALDEFKIRNSLMFRLHENSQVILVHNRIKERIEGGGMTGIKFVTPVDFLL